MTMRLPAVILLFQVFVPQRGDADCTTAALAMLAHTTYENVVAVERSMQMAPDDHTVRDIVAVAERLGLVLEPRPAIRGRDSGIIIVQRLAARHAVALHDGRVWDPRNSAPQDAGAYLDGERVVTFLKVVNDY